LIDPTLFVDPKPIDRVAHRGLRADFQRVRYDRLAKQNALFVTAIEFGDVCREYPIVFVDAGVNEQGKPEVAPVAVMGLSAGENLMLQADGSWAASYVPALLRGYPFGVVREGDANLVVVHDAAHAGLSADVGEPLFDDQGEPSEALQARRQFIEELERETVRTRAVCQRLQELDLLRPMRFDATLPDGKTVGVDGFHTVNDERFAALADAQVIELFRNGLLGLIHAHQLSLPLMRRLVERRFARAAAK
jgi:SapC